MYRIKWVQTMYDWMYVCHKFCNTLCSKTMWVHVLCTNYALVRSEFTVLMACPKKLCCSLSLVAVWLWRRFPDRSSWNSLLLVCWGSFMILQALVWHLLQQRSCGVGGVVAIVSPPSRHLAMDASYWALHVFAIFEVSLPCVFSQWNWLEASSSWESLLHTQVCN